MDWSPPGYRLSRDRRSRVQFWSPNLCNLDPPPTARGSRAPRGGPANCRGRTARKWSPGKGFAT